MPKSIKNIESLPEQARKLEPIHGFSIYNKSKQIFKVRCSKCKFIFETTWDKLTNKSTSEHCHVCRYAIDIESKFNDLLIKFKIKEYYHDPKLDQQSNPGKTGIQKYGAMARIIHSPCGKIIEKPLNNLRKISIGSHESNGSRSLKCEFCEESNKISFQERNLLTERAKNTWGKDVLINVKGNKFYIELLSFEGLYPPDEIPFEAIFDFQITGRLKGGIKGYITKKKLEQLLKQDEALLVSLKRSESIAESFGAKIKFISFRAGKCKYFSGSGYSSCLPKNAGIYIRYIKINKMISNWQGITRANNSNFGRNNIFAHQTMILCVLNELFKLNEKKQPVIWKENVKGFFSGNKELDIFGCNLLEELGGIQVEYQGYMTHRNDNATILRDKDKMIEAEKRGHFLMQIERINHISPENALSAVLDAIEKSTARVKNEFLKYINREPDINEIKKEYIYRLADRAEDCTKKLNDFCKEKNHKLLTIKDQYLKSDDVIYLCGNCNSKRVLNVKVLLETKSGCCNKCKRNEFNIKERERKLSYHIPDLWNNIPHEIKYQLVKEPLQNAIICPKCKNVNSKLGNIERLVNRIQQFQGFLCYYCLNTGEVKFQNGFSLGNCTQQKHHIIDIIKKTGWGDSEFWYNYVSFIETPVSASRGGNFEIALTLSCRKGHVNTKLMRKWRRILSKPTRKDSSSFCDTCSSE